MLKLLAGDHCQHHNLCCATSTYCTAPSKIPGSTSSTCSASPGLVRTAYYWLFTHSLYWDFTWMLLILDKGLNTYGGATLITSCLDCDRWLNLKDSTFPWTSSSLSVVFLSFSVYQSLLNRAENNPSYTAEEIPLGHTSTITSGVFLTLITTTSRKPATLTSLQSCGCPPVQPTPAFTLPHFHKLWPAYRPRRRHPPLPHASSHPGHPLRCRSQPSLLLFFFFLLLLCFFSSPPLVRLPGLQSLSE